MVYLWRAVDAEGEVLDVLVQSKRNKHAALKLMRKLLKKYAFVPERLVTDDLRSYGAAAHDLGIESRHQRGRWKNNRAENSHQPTRRRERWHLDEGFVKVNGKLCYLWRAVDHEGEVLEAVVTAKRDKAAALELLKRIMKKYGRPRSVVTDGLRAYSSAMNEIGNADRQEAGRRLNNRAENSHQPFRRRERAMQRFRSTKTLQKFSAVHAQVYNHSHGEGRVKSEVSPA